MPRRKKAPTPEGSDDIDSDIRVPASVKPDMVTIVENINQLKDERKDVQKAIEQDHKKRLTDLKSRISKHYQAGVLKRTKVVEKRMDRLAKAIEKKTACEDAIFKLTISLASDCEELTKLMTTVHTTRRESVHSAANS